MLDASCAEQVLPPGSDTESKHQPENTEFGVEEVSREPLATEAHGRHDVKGNDRLPE